MRSAVIISLLVAVVACALAQDPGIAPPGPDYAVPERETSSDAPRIFEHSQEAGADETFFVVGEGLTKDIVLWGMSAKAETGQEWRPRVQFCNGRYLAATLPGNCYDGVFVGWAKSDKGWSKPFRLNAPQCWWVMPDKARVGTEITLYGRNLARRPDFDRCSVLLKQVNAQAGRWLKVTECGKFRVKAELPADLPGGDYLLWCHTGSGGKFGWSNAVPIEIDARAIEEPRRIQPPATLTEADLRKAIAEAEAGGGGVVNLPSGVFEFNGTLKLGKGVVLSGMGKDETILRCVNRNAGFAKVQPGRWNAAPSGVHTPGDTMEYDLAVPKDGEWTVWLRYATEMSKWKQAGVSGNMVLIADEGEPVSLDNLPNTGSFGTFKWSRSAKMKLAKGRHRLVWKNIKGGGLSLDAMVFALDPGFKPSDTPFPDTSENLVVIQGEDCTKFECRDGSLPGRWHAAVWLCGDGSGLASLSIEGAPVVDVGILVRDEKFPRWIEDCAITNVRVRGVEGKRSENRAVHLCYARRASVCGNELWARAPIYMTGVRQCAIAENRLVCQTRFGGNALAAIVGRTNIIEECAIENNVVACPPGKEAGGPTVMRMMWVSTGHGSISRNYIAGNRADRARFGGVAGTQQNVGEMILFEACQRMMFHGRIESAGSRAVVLPKTVPRTPDDRLGSVKRESLPVDDKGNETPFWPPDLADDDGEGEPTIDQYYVTVLDGRGVGQTRRVARREGNLLTLDRPWREVPDAGALVVVSTLYYRNLIVGNETCDGMTGIQLWIGCVENIVSGNIIRRQRKPGLFLYSNCTTLASSMPRTWNRGIGPFFFNLCEGNLTDECSAGALLTSGDWPDMPIEFPRNMGNVIRHNSFIRSRTNGVIITSRKKTGDDPSPSVVGAIVELNVARDARIGYHVANNADFIVLRRNHAYFWYPVANTADRPVAFQLDHPGTYVLEQNTIEGISGTYHGSIIKERRVYEEKEAEEKK
ncbi:MAG: hypothetical protein GXP25_02180 [Planctomycetes bacterium]|nr:hypothetical protein [Planctomycetota bacterium]